MHFNYLHFFIDDLTTWHDRFVEEWGATPLGPATLDGAFAPQTRVLCLGRVPLVLSAPATPGDYVDRYLDHHPPGIGDVAFRVAHLETVVKRLMAQGATLVDAIRCGPGNSLKWCRVPGWGKLSHTLVQSSTPGAWVPGWGDLSSQLPPPSDQPIDGIDHAVLNVGSGQLAEAVEWYVRHFGFCPQQRFTIDTPKSGLKSQVLAHPQGDAQLPINEPATPNSQVQEFLTWNQGAGIQHVALRTPNILKTVRSLKEKGIEFLTVPTSYYQALKARPGYQLADTRLSAISGLEILMDWDPQSPQAYLLQTFTQPLLDIPTLFFEIIQRQTLTSSGVALEARGFGERNFQALFEAIEREQSKRGSLDASIS